MKRLSFALAALIVAGTADAQPCRPGMVLKNVYVNGRVTRQCVAIVHKSGTSCQLGQCAGEVPVPKIGACQTAQCVGKDAMQGAIARPGMDRVTPMRGDR